MSEELNTMTAEECLEELYGVDGDGLGEGEEVCEGELICPVLTLRPAAKRKHPKISRVVGL